MAIKTKLLLVNKRSSRACERDKHLTTTSTCALEDTSAKHNAVEEQHMQVDIYLMIKGTIRSMYYNHNSRK
jgi:hypothetical protein